MRISDWSSDVCSSDLSAGPSTPEFSQRADNHQQGERHPEYAVLPDDREIAAEPEPLIRMQQPREEEDDNSRDDDRGDIAIPPQLEERSEEHTSELQSLMRHSYAVFCLKKTNAINKKITHQAVLAT